MRIAFDYQIFSEQAYGGISRYFTQLALGLEDLQQQVGVFSPLYRNAYLSKLSTAIVHGRYLERYPAKTARLIRAYNRYRCRRLIARWRPELVHETYYATAGSAPTGCPAVVTVLDMIHELFPDSFAANDPTVIIKRHAVERADHVICISHNTKQDLMRLCDTPEHKISVVHLGFDRFSGSTETPRDGTLSGRPYIFYVGSRAGYKNFGGLLNAVASSDKLRANFDIVAFGGGEFTVGEKADISRLGFSENQVRYQSGGDDLLGTLYSSASAFVYPSLYEGFGIPPLEAMAHGCPVVCSNAGPLPEVVGEAVEFCEPGEPESMRDAIDRVVFSAKRSDELVKLGLERLGQFSWKKCSAETLDVYNKVLNG